MEDRKRLIAETMLSAMESEAQSLLGDNFSVPYYNRISVEMDVPIDVAKSMLALTAAMCPVIKNMPMPVGLALTGAMLCVFTNLSGPLGISEVRLERAMRRAIEVSAEMFRDADLLIRQKKGES